MEDCIFNMESYRHKLEEFRRVMYQTFMERMEETDATYVFNNSISYPILLSSAGCSYQFSDIVNSPTFHNWNFHNWNRLRSVYRDLQCSHDNNHLYR